MRVLLLFAFMLASAQAAAQIYRWVDSKGTIHYSNSAPPAGIKSTVVDPDAKEGPPAPDTYDCYTVRCQGERMEQRLARREELETRLAAERAAAAPQPPRGLEFRKYISIQRGMTEGALLTVAGAPDLLTHEPRVYKNYIYFPTPADPFTTTVTLVRGRVSDVDRVRKF